MDSDIGMTKVKVALQPAMEAQRGSRIIPILFLEPRR